MGCGNSIASPDDEEHLHTVVNGSTITGTPPRQCQGRADVSKMEGQLPPATTQADAPCTQASGEQPVVAKGSATGPFRDESFPAAQSSLGNLLDQQGDTSEWLSGRSEWQE